MIWKVSADYCACCCMHSLIFTQIFVIPSEFGNKDVSKAVMLQSVLNLKFDICLRKHMQLNSSYTTALESYFRKVRAELCATLVGLALDLQIKKM